MPRPEGPAPLPAELARLLAEAADDLELPHPARLGVLAELAQDAEALYLELRARGWEERAALARVRELLLPDREARAALWRLHGPLHARLSERFSPWAMRAWERAALALLAASALLGGAEALATVPFLGSPSPFLVPVALLGGAGLVLAVARSFHLFVRGERETARLTRGLGALLALAAGTAALAVAGALADLFRLAAAMEAAHDPSGRRILAFLRADAALLTVGLTLALVLALSWFLLLQWTATLSARERRLLEPHAAP